MGALDLDRAPSSPLAMISPSARRARAADLPALARLVNRAYAVEAAFVDGDRTDHAELAELAERGHFLVLDRPGGELAASIYVAVDGVHASFRLLAVAPELQRFGLGRRLVALAEALGSALGCHDMSLSIVNLRTELGPWYRSQGYREIGTAPFGHPGAKRACHMVQMAKPLAGAAN